MSAARRSIRAYVIALGLIGMGWGILQFSNLRKETLSSHIAERILAGDNVYIEATAEAALAQRLKAARIKERDTRAKKQQAS